ncbi:uncharacterized protein METZ01_LOCUS309704, partial [marine metagenome]
MTKWLLSIFIFKIPDKKIPNMCSNGPNSLNTYTSPVIGDKRNQGQNTMTYDGLKQRLDAGGIVILDGGMGTELQRRGAPMDPAAWCGPATLHAEKLLTEIHADYIAAGAEVITANTYASSRLMLSLSGYGDQVEEINRRSVEAALRARDAASRGTSVVVAGSLSHMVPMSKGTMTVDPGNLPNDVEMATAYDELARILA